MVRGIPLLTLSVRTSLTMAALKNAISFGNIFFFQNISSNLTLITNEPLSVNISKSHIFSLQRARRP